MATFLFYRLPNSYFAWTTFSYSSPAPPPHLSAPPPHLSASPPHLSDSPPHLSASLPHLSASPPHLSASPPHLSVPPPHLSAPPPHLSAPPPHLSASSSTRISMVVRLKEGALWRWSTSLPGVAITTSGLLRRQAS